MQTIAVSDQNQSQNLGTVRCVATIWILQHQPATAASLFLFSSSYCVSCPTVGMADGSWSPPWPCVFSFYGRCKVQSHLAVSALCWGRGSNPLALILPVQVACSHLFLQFSMQAVWLPLGATTLIMGK